MKQKPNLPCQRNENLLKSAKIKLSNSQQFKHLEHPLKNLHSWIEMLETIVEGILEYFVIYSYLDTVCHESYFLGEVFQCL